MTNHPNRGRFSNDQIRQYLMDRYDAEAAKTGDEAEEDEAGMYVGEDNSWVVLGVMPNTNQTGWFFAGYTADIVSDMRMERE
jgi:hypothetical protein